MYTKLDERSFVHACAVLAIQGVDCNDSSHTGCEHMTVIGLDTGMQMIIKSPLQAVLMAIEDGMEGCKICKG